MKTTQSIQSDCSAESFIGSINFQTEVCKQFSYDSLGKKLYSNLKRARDDRDRVLDGNQNLVAPIAVLQEIFFPPLVLQRNKQVIFRFNNSRRQ